MLQGESKLFFHQALFIMPAEKKFVHWPFNQVKICSLGGKVLAYFCINVNAREKFTEVFLSALKVTYFVQVKLNLL